MFISNLSFRHFTCQCLKLPLEVSMSNVSTNLLKPYPPSTGGRQRDNILMKRIRMNPTSKNIMSVDGEETKIKWEVPKRRKRLHGKEHMKSSQLNRQILADLDTLIKGDGALEGIDRDAMLKLLLKDWLYSLQKDYVRYTFLYIHIMHHCYIYIFIHICIYLYV
jgi:hypothetical protein